MPQALATVDGQLQLLISSAAHQVRWLQGLEDVKCVVDVEPLGVVRVQSLELWASARSLTSTEAESLLTNADTSDWLDTEHPRSFVVSAKRKKKPNRDTYNKGGSIHELTLPALAVLALFRQGTGPLKPKQGPKYNSGVVLLRTLSESFELIGQTQLDAQA